VLSKFGSGSDDSIIRNRSDLNPNWTKLPPGRTIPITRPFPLSAELEFSALKDTPVVAVRASPVWQDHTGRRFGRAQSRIHHQNDDTMVAAARSDPNGLMRALDRTTIDEVQRVPDLSPGHQEDSR
jgi:hypothetical protein